MSKGLRDKHTPRRYLVEGWAQCFSVRWVVKFTL